MSENRAGDQFIKVWEAEKLMTTMLKDYEKDVVGPRHQETQEELAAIKSIVQQGSGMVKLGGAIMTIASAFWLAIQIAHAVNH